MLECYEPSLVAWRILSRAADAFMTVEDEEAIAVMKRLASPLAGDPAIVAGEIGGVGLAGLIQVASSKELREQTGLGPDARIFPINTEGATPEDPKLYRAPSCWPRKEVRWNGSLRFSGGRGMGQGAVAMLNDGLMERFPF